MPAGIHAVLLTDHLVQPLFWELLFEPVLHWTLSACAELGLSSEELSLFSPLDSDGACVELEKLLSQKGTLLSGGNISSLLAVLKSSSAEHILLCGANLPLLTGELLQRSLANHQMQQADLTEIISKSGCPASSVTESGEKTACWIRRETLLKTLQDGFLYEELSRSLSSFFSALVNRVEETGGSTARWLDEGKDEAFLCSVTTRRGLFFLQERLCRKRIEELLDQGVEILSSDGVIVSRKAVIEAGTVIYPHTILKGAVTIGAGCRIGPNSVVEESQIGAHTVINASQVEFSQIGNGVTMGPFAHVRPNSVVEDGVHLGNFVEIKNSNIGARTAVSHLTYVGDSDVGEAVNFGCGCVTVNYDGKNKHRTTIGNHAFIGCNTNLVAPVKVGEQAFTAAGSTITKDVPDGALALERGRQIEKPGWAIGKIKLK